ncbi:MAG TPA: cupin [Actinomycetota bacterium]|nr:cupin [Actinomycetota bacterium]
MGSIELKRFDQPDEVEELGDKGRAEIVTIDDVTVVRSILQPGWSWIEHIQPMTGGLESCPLHHREYVVAGRIRYDVVGGGSVEAGPGTYLDIEPGHLASVVGDEPCIVIDWGEGLGHSERPGG